MRRNKWDHKDLKITDFKRKLTIAAVAQVAVVIMMNTQLYIFNAKYSGRPVSVQES